MIIDYHINDIIESIIADFKKEGILLTREAVIDIIDFQFKSAAKSFTQGENFRFPLLGSFKIKKGRIELLNEYLISHGATPKIINAKDEQTNKPLRIVFDSDGKIKNITEHTEINKLDKRANVYLTKVVSRSNE